MSKNKEELGESKAAEDKEEAKEAADTNRPRKAKRDGVMCRDCKMRHEPGEHTKKRTENKAKNDKANGVSKPEEKEAGESGAKYRSKHRLASKPGNKATALGQKPIKKHAAGPNTPTGYRKLAQRINSGGSQKEKGGMKGAIDKILRGHK